MFIKKTRIKHLLFLAIVSTILFLCCLVNCSGGNGGSGNIDPGPTPTLTPTQTPTPTSSPTQTPTPTPSSSPSFTPTASPSQSLTPTDSPTLTPTESPTATETPTPTPTPTSSPVLNKIIIEGFTTDLNGRILVYKEGVTPFITQIEVINGVVNGDIYVADGKYRFVTSFTGVTTKYYPNPITYVEINTNTNINYDNFVDN